MDISWVAAYVLIILIWAGVFLLSIFCLATTVSKEKINQFIYFDLPTYGQSRKLAGCVSFEQNGFTRCV